MTTEHVSCLKINCPEPFADAAFVRWLRVGAAGDEGAPVATWHRGERAGEYSDAFVTYESHPGCWPADGSDSDMPEHCWDGLCEAVRKTGVTGFAVLWLTNLGG